MKKLLVVVLVGLLLCGCGAAETFERVEDVMGTGGAPLPKKVVLDVPQGAQVIHGDSGRLYLCNGYEIAVETLSSGNLDGTMRSITGFGREALTVMETSVSEMNRYECAWSTTGEGGASVARAAVIDDGAYHYCVTVIAPADQAGKLANEWQSLFESLRLE